MMGAVNLLPGALPLSRFGDGTGSPVYTAGFSRFLPELITKPAMETSIGTLGLMKGIFPKSYPKIGNCF